MKNAPNIFQLPKLKKRQKKDDKLQPPKQDEPLPWGEGEPEVPQPPFLPAA